MCLFCFRLPADIVPPAVTCPGSLPPQFVDPGMPDAAVSWSAPTAVDTFDSAVSSAPIVCMDHRGNVVVSGARIPVGPTLVTCRVSDAALNEGSCQFNITVVGECSFFIKIFAVFIFNFTSF